MHNNTSNIDYITICDYNKIPKEKLKIVPKKSYDNTKVYQLYANDWECNLDTDCSEKFCMCVPSEDKKIGTFGGTKSMVTAHHMILQLNFLQMISNTSKICIMNI